MRIRKEHKREIIVGAAGLIVMLILAVTSCGPSRKVIYLQRNAVGATLSLASDTPLSTILPNVPQKRDTFEVHDFEGRKVILMKAVRDEDGSMIASDVLDPVYVTARFRNVAERHGKVDIQFNITVPQAMQDKAWQLRFQPDMYIMGDTLKLDPVVITGTDYRRAQLRGYQQYDRFIAGIVSDSTRFINMWQLDLFIQRNMPSLYAFRKDSSYVSDEQFRSVFGVGEAEAIEHYTDKLARGVNNWKKGRMGRMFRKLVKVPIEKEGIRLDTVLAGVGGDFIYSYTQTINTRPRLRQVDIVLSGEIFEQDQKIYTIPRSEPLTFYISSLSSFVDSRERYLTKVVERRASANSACYVAFEQGRSEVREDYAGNAGEIGRIKGNIRELLMNVTFDLDSIVVATSSSPEGSVAFNGKLSARRSGAIATYMNRYLHAVQDSLDRENGFSVDEKGHIEHQQKVKIDFIARSTPENWDMLDELIREDETLTPEQKERYFCIRAEKDADRREASLSHEPFYKHLREDLYPRVRTVRFDFFLHRKGMVKDTVHTTELDSVYMAGIQAIKDRDYELAIKHLAPYGDYNTAVAYCALDRNMSARLILESLERTANVSYMLALVYAREGDTRAAVECYLEAVKMEPSYKFRGNLDPEIRALVKMYSLDKIYEEQDNTDLGF